MKLKGVPPQNDPVRDQGASWLRFLGAGLELSGITLVFAAIGFGLDRWLENERMIATGIGSLVGFALGMVRFVVRALASMQVGSTSRRRHL